MECAETVVLKFREHCAQIHLCNGFGFGIIKIQPVIESIYPDISFRVALDVRYRFLVQGRTEETVVVETLLIAVMYSHSLIVRSEPYIVLGIGEYRIYDEVRHFKRESALALMYQGT